MRVLHSPEIVYLNNVRMESEEVSDIFLLRPIVKFVTSCLGCSRKRYECKVRSQPKGHSPLNSCFLELIQHIEAIQECMHLRVTFTIFLKLLFSFQVTQVVASYSVFLRPEYRGQRKADSYEARLRAVQKTSETIIRQPGLSVFCLPDSTRCG